MIEMVFGKIINFCKEMDSCEKCPFCKDLRQDNHYRCVFRYAPEEWNSTVIEKYYLEMCRILYVRDKENEENE